MSINHASFFNNVSPQQALNQQLITAATQPNQADTVIRLIREGAYVNTTDVLGNTPLMLAIQKGHTQTVMTLLLCHCIQINQSNVFGDTPIVEAVRRNQLDLAGILQQHGAVLPREAASLTFSVHHNRRGVKRSCPNEGFDESREPRNNARFSQ
jgi:ankyrin repeat protein